VKKDVKSKVTAKKWLKSADFFDTVILSLFSYIEQQVSYNCGIELIHQKQIDSILQIYKMITKEA